MWAPCCRSWSRPASRFPLKNNGELVGLSRDLLIVLVLLGGWLIFTAGKNNTSTRFARTKQLSQRCDTCPAVSFNDVAGISEAREELKELTDFLRTPQRYEKLGGRIPHGVLLEGPPGTGKTLLAKAIAGEASVPFLSPERLRLRGDVRRPRRLPGT